MRPGRQPRDRVKLHRQFFDTIQTAQRRGLSVANLALATNFPNAGFFSRQLHASGVPATSLNLSRWQRVAAILRYEGPVFEDATEAAQVESASEPVAAVR